MKKCFFLLCFIAANSILIAQNVLRCSVKDSVTHEELPGVIVIIGEGKISATTDAEGKALVTNIPDGRQKVELRIIGYKSQKFELEFPLLKSDAYYTYYIASLSNQLEEVLVTTTRTNSRVEDLATKVEVLGQEDMEEESSIVPGSVSSILGDLSIITIQKTSPINGNEAIRMQGLDARYTQIMRDGIPLYGGFSGSLGVLAIPPLDLKQIEIIKGSASTLYGAGAIGGLINFVSKTPSDSDFTTATLNINSLKEMNINTFSSEKRKKFGYTIFGGVNKKAKADINGDGFTEVPDDLAITIHPKLFYQIDQKNSAIIGITSIWDKRVSGDLLAINNTTDTAHTYFEKENTQRNTIDLLLASEQFSKHKITLKAAVSDFYRSSNISNFIFKGRQYSGYIELTDAVNIRKHSIVVGTNYTGESFKKTGIASSNLNNFNQNTPGVFVQDDWQALQKFSIQMGLRLDYASLERLLLLPRLSLFYKQSSQLSFRLAAGSGYKNPNIFDFFSPSSAITNIPKGLKREESFGSNADINFHTWLLNDISIQIDQAFYYTHIKNPVQVMLLSNGLQTLENSSRSVESYGTDTYLRIKYKEIETYLGLNHTIAKQGSGSQIVYMPFNPQNKLSLTLAYEIEGKWRLGTEASYTSNQYIYNNERVPNLLFLAAMIERKFSNWSFVFNCENLLDNRQSSFESLYQGSIKQPEFRPIWGPLEGRVINFSVKKTL